MTRILWKGLGSGFSPDPILVDDLIGKRLRKSGLKCSRTRGKCTFASTSRSQAEDYADGPGNLVQVLPEPGATLTWSPDAGDLILNFETFLRREPWADMDWASPRAREIIIDAAGCIGTFEQYIHHFPHSRALPKIIDEFLDRISMMEIDYQSPEQMTDVLRDHDGEVWITGSCKLIQPPASQSSKEAVSLAA